jgi:hypothetical protein
MTLKKSGKEDLGIVILLVVLFLIFLVFIESQGLRGISYLVH